MNYINQHILELPEKIHGTNWNTKIEYLFEQQFENWELAKNHYHQLASIEKRTIHFDYFRIDIQHNPGRVRSTCANVSKEEIEKRPCFLCANNLPDDQKGFIISKKYLLLINPFPIFEKHLTISDFSHTPQLLKNRIIDMLKIAETLPAFTIFYNGAQCGASAPDHFHFQAAQKGIMPIDNEIESLKLKHGKILLKNNEITIFQIENYLRSVLIFESENPEFIETYFSKVINQLPINDQSGEPMMNVLANFENNKFRINLFPRSAQRPSCYYKEGPDRILVSPASVELGGIIITPREDDYQKIKKNDLIDIFNEVNKPFNFHFKV